MTRPVEVADADMLVPLFAELDHPATASRIAQRLVRLRADDTYQAWVTIASDGDVVCGFAAGHLVHPIEDDNVAAQLIALVTASTSRGIGAGAMSCAAFEDWAIARGAWRAVVNSGLRRTSAHAFYEHQGWTHTGLRLGKDLTDR